MKKTALILLILNLLLSISCIQAKIPTDKQMIDNFTKHKKIFNELVGMTYSNYDFISIYTKNNNKDKVWNMPSHVLLKYKVLLKLANLRKIWIAKNRKKIILGYYYYDASKEYVYTKKPPFPLYDNLDKYSGQINISVYRHIEGNWYLKYSE